jgi:hypothetical protein
VFVVTPPLEDPGVDEAVESIGKHVARDAQVTAELIEASDPEMRVAQDQQAPSVAEQVQAVGDHAVEGIHAVDGSEWVVICN